MAIYKTEDVDVKYYSALGSEDKATASGSIFAKVSHSQADAVVQKVESTIMNREADSRALHLRPIRRIVIPTKQELDDKPVKNRPLPKNNEDDEAMSQIENEPAHAVVTQKVSHSTRAWPSTLTSGPNCITRDGRMLAKVEVVLPHWEDVRQRKSRQAASPSMRQLEESRFEQLIKLEQHDPAEVAQALHEAVEELNNPDVKIKKEPVLSDDALLDALTWEGINHRHPIPVARDIAEYGFDRKYISHLYGGNNQELSPSPAKEKLNWHGLNDWLFLRPDYNPHAPTCPGRSGLYFSSRSRHNIWQEPQRTFVQFKPSQWVYMGQYDVKPRGTLTTDAWKGQKAPVKWAWVTGILSMGWGNEICTRIWLRRQYGDDYEATKEDYKGGAFIKQVRAALTEHDVTSAFEQGIEAIGIYTMKCVGYDEDFIRVLARNAPRWAAEQAGQKKEKKRAGSRGKDKDKGTGGTGTKRKHIDVDLNLGLNPDVGEASEMVEEQVTEGAPNHAYRRSTRPRAKRVRTS